MPYLDIDDGPRQSITPGWTYRKMGPRWVLRQGKWIVTTSRDVTDLFRFCRTNRIRPEHEPQVNNDS